MPHFMRSEDQEEQRGVRNPPGQTGDVNEGAPRQVEVERALPNPTSGHRRGQKSRDQEPRVKPQSRAIATRGGVGFVHETPREKVPDGRRVYQPGPSLMRPLLRTGTALWSGRFTSKRPGGS